MSFSWKRFLQIGKIIFPFVVLTIVFFQAKKELATYMLLDKKNIDEVIKYSKLSKDKVIEIKSKLSL